MKKQNKTNQRERDVRRLSKMQELENEKKVEIAQLKAQMELIHYEISELKKKLGKNIYSKTKKKPKEETDEERTKRMYVKGKDPLTQLKKLGF